MVTNNSIQQFRGICLLLLFQLTAFCSFSSIGGKGTISGTITDAGSGIPLHGVSIFLADLKLGSQTDKNGHYSIPNIPEGFHLVEFSHVGYNSQVLKVRITGATQQDVQLTASVVENNAVIVTGVSTATQLKKAPFQVSIIRKEDFRQQAASSLVEALTRIPGVAAFSTGPAIAKPVIRGLGFNRVITINDGIRQEGQQWGEEHGLEIDAAGVNRVELLKGPASLMYGSDAMAGVLNIISHEALPNNSMRLNVLSEYQTNNRSRQVHGNWGGNIDGINWNFYGTTQAAADYQNAFDGRVFNSKFRQTNLGGHVGYNGNWGYSHLIWSRYDLKTGLIEGERDPLGYFIKSIAGGGTTRASKDDFLSTMPDFPYQRIRHQKLVWDNQLKLGSGKLQVVAGYQRNQREEFGNVDDPEERELFFDLTSYNYSAQYHFAEKAGWQTSIGASSMHQKNNNRGAEQLIPDYTLNDWGGFFYSKKTIKKINFSAGARFDSRSLNAAPLMDGTDIKGAAFKKTFSNISASAGITAQLNQQLNIKLNLARSFRAPNMAELASNGAHEGTTRYEYGSIDLKSEVSTQLDAGLEFNTDHVSFNAAAYYNNFSNFIYYRKLENASGSDSLVEQDGEMLTAFRFDQQGAVLSGFEAGIDIHPHPLDWLHIENTFSFVRGRFKSKIENSDAIPFIPAPRLLTEFRANIGKLDKAVKNLYLKLEIDNNFAQEQVFTTYNTETATPGYTLLNFGAGAEFTNKEGKTLFKLYFSANNLTDKAYQNHLSRLKYSSENLATGRTGVFNMGRNLSFKILVPLQFDLNK